MRHLTPFKSVFQKFLGFGDASPSLDSSFAEDLNELEGVIQSLQDETFKFTTSVADSRSNWSVDDYKNSLKNEASIVSIDVCVIFIVELCAF